MLTHGTRFVRSLAAMCVAASTVAPMASAEACHRRPVYVAHPAYVVPAYSPVTYPVQTTVTVAPQPTTAALVAQAKKMLKAREYVAAQQAINAALAREPKNSALMQLKSLIAFAQGDFRQSAAMAYSALTLGRSLDWNAVRQLYPSAAEYAEQYRRLAMMAKETPDQPHLQFLLAYHHLMLGHQKEGRMALEQAQKMLPQDKLISLLLTQVPAMPKSTEPPSATTLAADDLPPAE
jgi:predicted Zn-dependent protease